MAVKKLTMVAAQAVGFAELFKAVFADGLQGQVNYRVELSEPDGPSTAGGKLALQHIKLVPPEGPTLVMGWANTVEKTAELRTFAFLADQHAQRFKGASLPIDPSRYAALLQSLQTFFADRGMAVSLLDASRSAAPPVPQVAASSTPPALVIVGVLMLLVLVAGGVFLALK